MKQKFANEEVKLNLASGTDIRDGWQNLDIVKKWPIARRGCDVVWDARKDKIPFGDDSAVEIYAGYLLLYLSPQFHKSVLAEIKRVLSPSGFVVFGEVDMQIVMSRYLDNPADSRISELIWGGQRSFHGDLSNYDKHCQGFTQTTLEDLLEECGFCDFQRIKIHSHEVFYELTMKCRK